MRTTRLLLAALLGLAAGSRVLATDPRWTPAQTAIAARVQAWEVAARAGRVDAIMRLTAPSFMGWDLTKPTPVDRAGYRAEQAAFFGHFKVLECDLPITAIQIENDTAAVHGRYLETVQDLTGARQILQGAWTASFLRKGRQWFFLSLSYLADPPATNEAEIKAGVVAALDTFKAAVETVDLAATLATAADVPEFRYTTYAGTVMDFAGWKQEHVEYYPTVTAHRLVTKIQDIAVLGPDAALVTWTGALEIVPKESAVLHIDPFSASFVFKRRGGVWKLVAQHESCPPAKAVDPTASATMQLRAAAPSPVPSAIVPSNRTPAPAPSPARAPSFVIPAPLP